MVMKIDPIPTFYNGINYRSRLEARWATFLTAMGIKFHYEYNAYSLPTANYLPDFYIPGVNPLYVEIKPDITLPDKVWKLCQELANETEIPTILLRGPVSIGVGVTLFRSRDRDTYPWDLECMAERLVPGYKPLRFDHSIHLAKNNRFGT